jgi:hypothetical protein
MNSVTKKLVDQFKVGDEVEIYFGWVRGTLTKYEIDELKQGVNPAAHFEVEPHWDAEGIIITSWFQEGEQSTLRTPVSPEAYARYTVKRVLT